MKRRAIKRNGAVWLDGELVCIDQKPHMKLSARELLSGHLCDQRAYIARLTERADKVESFLKNKA